MTNNKITDAYQHVLELETLVGLAEKLVPVDSPLLTLAPLARRHLAVIGETVAELEVETAVGA